MNIETHWEDVRKHFNRNFSSNFHVAIASVDTSDMPRNTPIGTLFLNRDRTGFYFEKYPVELPHAAQHNSNICILSVNSRFSFWIRSLLTGNFRTYPGIKLYGTLQERRPASEIEKNRLRRRMRFTRWTIGNRLLWGDMNMIREITFVRAESIDLGALTEKSL